MNFSLKNENDIGLITVEGDIILTGASELKHYLSQFLDDKNYKGILFDFLKVSQIDSGGLGIIVGAFKTLQQRQAKMAIFNANDQVGKVFKLTQLNKIIKVFNSQNEALAYLSN